MPSSMRAPATVTGPDLRDLQRRVLGAVARTVDRRSVPTAWPPDAVATLATGLSDLLGARPPGTTADPAVLLVRAAEALEDLAEAARRVGVACAGTGHEGAADTADAVMTVALALRMLVEAARRPPD